MQYIMSTLSRAGRHFVSVDSWTIDNRYELIIRNLIITIVIQFV